MGQGGPPRGRVGYLAFQGGWDFCVTVCSFSSPRASMKVARGVATLLAGTMLAGLPVAAEAQQRDRKSVV